MAVKSSYNRQFGERPKEEEAFHIVKKKRFSELDFASILKPGPLFMIEKWINGESEEEFTSRVFFTLRDMYTIVRGKSCFATTNRDLYVDAPKYVGSQPPRFDLFEKHQNASLRATATNMAIEAKKKHAATMRGQSNPTSAQLLKNFQFESLIEPKGFRHEDLKGDSGLIYFLNPRDQSFTHYAGNFGGKQVDDKFKAEILDTFTTSAMQMPSPDPVVQNKGFARSKRFDTETKNISNRMPLTNTLSPGGSNNMQQTGNTRFFDSNAFNSTH